MHYGTASVRRRKRWLWSLSGVGLPAPEIDPVSELVRAFDGELIEHPAGRGWHGARALSGAPRPLGAIGVGPQGPALARLGRSRGVHVPVVRPGRCLVPPRAACPAGRIRPIARPIADARSPAGRGARVSVPAPLPFASHAGPNASNRGGSGGSGHGPRSRRAPSVHPTGLGTRRGEEIRRRP